LLEIMVAIVLFMIVLSAIYSTWYTVVHGSIIAQAAAAEAQRSRMAMHTIQDALSTAQSFGADIQYYGFTYDSSDEASLSFVSHLSKTFPRSGKFGDFDVRRVTFSIESGANSAKELVLRQNPILMDLDKDEQQHPVVLAKYVEKFEVKFWDRRLGDWIDDWTLTNQLPPMVKVTLQFGSANREAPPSDPVTEVVSLPSVTVQPMWQLTTPQPVPNAQQQPPNLNGQGGNGTQNPPPPQVAPNPGSLR
jgi:type II secretory pathway pseudopilin PulG